MERADWLGQNKSNSLGQFVQAGGKVNLYGGLATRPLVRYSVPNAVKPLFLQLLDNWLLVEL